MTLGTFILKNALRNKRRATLSILSVAVSLFLLVTLLVALREITQPPEDASSALRIVVRNKVSLGQFLPARQRLVIQRIPGVEAVSPFTWFGGQFRSDEAVMFAQFALDAKLLPILLPDAKMSEDDYAAFLKERTACVVGKLTAEKYHLKRGDKMVLTSFIFGKTVTLKITGIYSGTADDRNVMFHAEYLDETIRNPGWVGTWWVKVKSADDMPRIISDINKVFANTSAEVRAETERAFQLSFISMWGNIKLFIGSICTVVVFTLMLVSASTMSMAIRERFRELAVLKAIGFRRRELFAFILAESFGLAMFGALVGIGTAWFVYMKLHAMQKLTGGIFILFDVTPGVIALALFIAAALGIVASIGPAVSVARTSVVQGLKTLD